MLYKKKLFLLGITATLLAIIYILTLVLDPTRTNARNERFTWFLPDSRDEADRIELMRRGEKLELFFKEGSWYTLLGHADASVEVPVRQGRIDDLFRLLSTRGAFPRRGSSNKSHEELGLDGSTRLVIRGGKGLPLLDLLVGKDDSLGKSVFLRKNGENEFRSGDKLIGTYVNGDTNSWLNLKLFEDASVAQVQRVLVNFSDFYGIGEEISLVPYSNYVITRSDDNWLMDGTLTLDKDRTENWIRAILEAQGEKIIASETELDNSFSAAARILVEFGDGSIFDFQIEEPDETEKSMALVSGKPYYFVLSQWTAIRLLRGKDFFRQ